MVVKVKMTMNDDSVVEYFGKTAKWTGAEVKLTLSDDSLVTIPAGSFKKFSISNAQASA